MTPPHFRCFEAYREKKQLQSLDSRGFWNFLVVKPLPREPKSKRKQTSGGLRCLRMFFFSDSPRYIDVEPKWLIMEKPYEQMDDLGVPLFLGWHPYILIWWRCEPSFTFTCSISSMDFAGNILRKWSLDVPGIFRKGLVTGLQTYL